MASSQSLAVYVRVKPCRGENQAHDELSIDRGEGSDSLTLRHTAFAVDACFDIDSNQQQIFQAVAEAQLEMIMGGYSAAILAYGAP